MIYASNPQCSPQLGHQHHLGACFKCTFSPPPPDLQNQNSGDGSNSLNFSKPSQRPGCVPRLQSCRSTPVPSDTRATNYTWLFRFKLIQLKFPFLVHANHIWSDQQLPCQTVQRTCSSLRKHYTAPKPLNSAAKGLCTSASARCFYPVLGSL